MRPSHQTRLLIGLLIVVGILAVLLLPVMPLGWLFSVVEQLRTKSEDKIYQAPMSTSANMPTLPLAERWCIHSDSYPLSYPIYREGLVFVLSGRRPSTAIRAYEATTGKLQWTAPVPTPALAVSYWLVEEDYVVVGDRSSLHVLEAKTGKQLWQLSAHTNRGMAVGENKLFVGGIEKIEAYELATGVKIWQIPGQGRGVENIPFYDATDHVIVLDGITFRLVDGNTGTILLDAKAPPADGSSYLWGQLYDGYLLYFDRAIDVRTGRLIHARTIVSSQSLPASVAENTLLLSAYTDVVATSLSNFAEVWRYQSPSLEGKQLQVLGDPVVLGKTVYIILSDASLRAIDLVTGRETGKWQGESVADRRFNNTPFVAGLASGDSMLFASFGTDELCAFGEQP
jgi:outer membrane protein assembly factor BamB